MAIDKKINYEIQGGVKNYLGKQKQVQAPIKWKSSPNHPETELAYITKAEKNLLVKKDLHGSLKGGVNRGPSGIMSLNGFGSTDESQNVSGSQMSAAETGNSSGFSGTGTGGGPALPPGVTQKPNQTALDIRSAFINAGGGRRVNPGFFDSQNTISPAELAMAKAYRQDPNNLFGSGAYRNTRGGIMNMIKSGGITGNLIRGLGQKFGFGKTYDEPTYDMSEFSDYGIDGTPPSTLDFNPDAKISDTSFTQGTIPTAEFNIGDKFFSNNPEVKNMMGYGITETEPFGNPNRFNSDIAPQFQDLAVNVGNYSQNEVSKQLYGKEYDVLDPFTQQKIDSLIEQVGTKSDGKLAGNDA